MMQPNLPLACPLPVDPTGICGKGLHVVWTSSRGLYLLDVTFPEPIGNDGSWVQSWTVECEDGHVVLVPDDPGCKHEDEIAGQPDHMCDVDPTEEFRTFRASDAARLAVVLQKLNAGNVAGHDAQTVAVEQL